MKKTNLLFILMLIVFVFVGCGPVEEPHKHEFSNDWVYDWENHWNPTTCGHPETQNKAPHQWDEGVVTLEPTTEASGMIKYTCIVCGMEKEDVLPSKEHVHQESEEWFSDAENHYKKCECGEVLKYSRHSFGEGVVTKEPTETEEGTKEFICSICKFKLTEIIPYEHQHTFSDEWTTDPLGHWHVMNCGHNDYINDFAEHQWDEGVVTVEPTTSTQGEKKYTCLVCSYEKTEIIPNLPPHDHTFAGYWVTDDFTHYHPSTCGCTDVKGEEGTHIWDEGVVTVQPTEFAEGYIKYTCTVCEYFKVEELPKHVHSYDTKYSFDTQYHWYQATCGCDINEGLELHTFDDGVITVVPTVDAVGIKEYTCSGCNFKYQEELPKHVHTLSQSYEFDGSNHWRKATCEHTDYLGDLAEHTYTQEVVFEADCGNDGKLRKTCYCGYSYEEAIPATQKHNYKETVVKVADCGTSGEIVKTCTVCNDTYTELTDPTGNHNYSLEVIWLDDNQSALERSTCSVCNYQFDSAKQAATIEVINQKVYCTDEELTKYTVVIGENTYYVTVVTKNASICNLIDHSAQEVTCLVNGWDAYQTCTKCPYTTFKEIVAPGHDYQEEVIAPTCTEGGYTIFTCHCGASYIGDEVNLLGHDYKYVSAKAPTCDEDGNKEYYICDRCFEIKDLEEIPLIPAKGHLVAGEYFGENVVKGKMYEVDFTFGTWTEEAAQNGSFTTYHNDADFWIIMNVDAVIEISFQQNIWWEERNRLGTFYILTEEYNSYENPLYKNGSLHNQLFEDTDEYVKWETITLTVSKGEKIMFMYLNSANNERSHFNMNMSISQYDYLAGNKFENVRVTSENVHFLPDSCLEDIYCLECNKITKAALGHDLINVDYLAPTCTTRGNNAHEYCTRCDYTTLEELALVDHVYQETEYCVNCNIHQPTEGIIYELSTDGTHYLASGISADCQETELYFDNHYNNLPVLGVKEDAFKNNTVITKVSFPKEYVSIASGAFNGCTSLEEISIFNLDLHYNTFNNSKIKTFTGPLAMIRLLDVENLENLLIIDTEEINSEHFYEVYYTDITSLELLQFDATVKKFDADVFKRFKGITKVNFIGTLEDWMKIEFVNEYSNPITASKNLYINDTLLTKVDDTDLNVTSILDYTFASLESLTEVVLTKVKNVSVEAFKNSGVTKLSIGKNLLTITPETFEGTALDEIIVNESNRKYTSYLGSLILKQTKELVIASSQLTVIDENISIIGPNAFMLHNDITELVIPTETLVKEKGLAHLTKLETLTISQLAKYSLDEQYPLQLKSLFGYYAPATLTKVIIPDGSAIHDSAFEDCGAVKEIILADSISQIGSYAFAGTGISEIKLPASLYTAGEGMLARCYNLTKVVTPFVGDSKNSMNNYHLDYFFGKKEFSGSVVTLNGYQYPANFTDIEITSNSYRIDLSNCITLKNITLPSTITALYTNALKGCTGIEEIELPESLTSLQDSAFEGCSNLKKIVIPANVDFFGNKVFKDCTSLTEVTYLAKAYATGRQMFEGCTALEIFDYPETLATIDSYTFKDCISLKEFIVKETVLNINSNAFEGCSALESLYLPDKTVLGSEALKGCSSLKSLDVPCLGLQATSATTVYTSIKYWFGSEEFEGGYLASSTTTGKYLPTSLTEVTVRGGKVSSGDLSYCYEITSLNLDGVTKIYSGALAGLHKLEKLVIPFVGETDTATGYKAIFGYVFGATEYQGSVALTQFYDPTNSKTNYIPESLKKLEITNPKALQYGALSEVKLESISINFGTLEYLDAGALINTEGLSTITEDNCIYLGSSDNPYSLLMDVVDKTVTEVTIHPDCKNIGAKALANLVNVTELIIPEGVTSIGANALEGCTALQSLTVPFVGASIDAQGIQGLLGYIFGETANELCTATEQSYNESSTVTYYLPTSLTTLVVNGGVLKYGALSNCKKITELTLNNITAIESRALYSCTGLTSLVIPETVQSIGFEALNAAQNIESLTLPFAGSKKMDHNVDTASQESLFGYIFGTTSYKATAAANQRYSDTDKIKYYIPSMLREITILGGDILYGTFSGLYNGQFDEDNESNSYFNLEITLGSDVTYVGDYAFAYAYWDNSEYGFGYPAMFFRGLTSVTFEGDLTYLGSNVFYNLQMLRYIYFEGNLENLEFDTNVFNGYSTTVLYTANTDDNGAIVKYTMDATISLPGSELDYPFALFVLETFPNLEMNG